MDRVDRGRPAEVSNQAQLSIDHKVRRQRPLPNRGTAQSPEMVGRCDGPAGSFRRAVTLPEEVRPVNVVSIWVLPSSSRIGH